MLDLRLSLMDAFCCQWLWLWLSFITTMISSVTVLGLDRRWDLYANRSCCCSCWRQELIAKLKKIQQQTRKLQVCISIETFSREWVRNISRG